LLLVPSAASAGFSTKRRIVPVLRRRAYTP